jgi:hypothetical protein
VVPASPGPCASAPGTPALTQPANEFVADRPTSLSPDTFPSKDQLMMILHSHFNSLGQDFWSEHKAKLDDLIEDFIKTDNKDRHDRATDQLLNYIHLFSEDPKFGPDDKDLDQLKDILLRRLGSSEQV